MHRVMRLYQLEINFLEDQIHRQVPLVPIQVQRIQVPDFSDFWRVASEVDGMLAALSFKVAARRM